MPSIRRDRVGSGNDQGVPMPRRRKDIEFLDYAQREIGQNEIKTEGR